MSKINMVEMSILFIMFDELIRIHECIIKIYKIRKDMKINQPTTMTYTMGKMQLIARSNMMHESGLKALEHV